MTWLICPASTSTGQRSAAIWMSPAHWPSQDKANTLFEEFDKRDGVPHRGTTFSKGEELLGKRSSPLTRLFRRGQVGHHFRIRLGRHFGRET